MAKAKPYLVSIRIDCLVFIEPNEAEVHGDVMLEDTLDGLFGQHPGMSSTARVKVTPLRHQT